MRCAVGSRLRRGPEVEVAAAVGRDRAVDAGARTEERRRDLSRSAPGRAEQEDVDGQQMPITRRTQLRQQLRLFGLWKVKYRGSRHSRFTFDKGLGSTYRFLRKNLSVPLS